MPVFEELFWRSFLMRWMIDNDFLKVPIGKVTPLAAAVTSILFRVRTRMAASALDRCTLGVALVVDQVALSLPDQPHDGQPCAGTLCNRHPRLEVLVNPSPWSFAPC